MTNTPPPAFSSPPPPPKRRGCFFYGCLSCGILVLLAVICVGLVAWYAVHTVNAIIAQYTDSQAVALPQDHLSQAELLDVSNRFAAFQSALDAGSNAAPLVLTGPEINGLFAASTNQDFRQITNYFHVEIQGDQIKGEVSLPFDLFATNLPSVFHLKGRYLNADASFTAVLTNNQLNVHIVSADVHGRPLPDKIMAALSQQDIAQKATQDTNTAQAITHFDSILIQDGKLIITPKKPQQ
jgi:hypothetical protein